MVRPRPLRRLRKQQLHRPAASRSMEAQRIRRLGSVVVVPMGRALKRIQVIPTSIRQRGWRLPSMSSFQIAPPPPPLLPAMLHLLQGRAARLLAPRLWAMAATVLMGLAMHLTQTVSLKWTLMAMHPMSGPMAPLQPVMLAGRSG